MNLETVFIFTISLILLWVKPGPGQALKITRTLNDGFLAGFSIVLGIITACLIFFCIAVLGASFVINFFNHASLFLKIIGGSYLVYLGVKGFLAIEKGKWKEAATSSRQRRVFENYSLGLFITLANPLPILYFLSIMPTLVPVGVFSQTDIIKGASIIVLVGLIVDTVLLLLVHQAKEALSDTKFIKKLNIVTSAGFILIGLFLIYSIF